MPDLDLARLAFDLQRLRSGLGSDARRRELRQRLTQVDVKLREERNLERLRQANLKVRLNSLDTRLDNAVLQRALERSTARLQELDAAILSAIAEQLRKRSP